MRVKKIKLGQTAASYLVFIQYSMTLIFCSNNWEHNYIIFYFYFTLTKIQIMMFFIIKALGKNVTY
jgi:hypothetical protein